MTASMATFILTENLFREHEKEIQREKVKKTISLFEPSIKEVVIIDPPKSHKEGPYFLGVLRVLDIPDALGLLAPNVKLTLINARDPVFDRTEQIYKLAGAADKLVRK